MRYQNVLFDLDGTLTDPGLGITNSVMYALKKYEICVPNREVLYPFTGPPLLESFMKYYHMTQPQAMQAITYYREYFSDTGIFENQVYPGIGLLLKGLKEEGFHLAVATSKPEVFAQRIVKHFDLEPYFDFVAGSLMDETRVNKDEVIRYALDRGRFVPGETVMVGDRMHDVLGAKKNGLSCLGVLYGYGGQEELIKAGAAALFSSPEELLTFLLKK